MRAPSQRSFDTWRPSAARIRAAGRGDSAFLDITGLTIALGDKILDPRAGYRFRAPHLASLKFFDWAGNPNDNGQALIAYTEEGLDLLRAHTRFNESVLGFGIK